MNELRVDAELLRILIDFATENWSAFAFTAESEYGIMEEELESMVDIAKENL